MSDDQYKARLSELEQKVQGLQLDLLKVREMLYMLAGADWEVVEAAFAATRQDTSEGAKRLDMLSDLHSQLNEANWRSDV